MRSRVFKARGLGRDFPAVAHHQTAAGCQDLRHASRLCLLCFAQGVTRVPVH